MKRIHLILLVLVIAGVSKLLYVEYVELPRERAEHILKEGKKKWGDMKPPAKYKEFCEKNEFQWNIKYQTEMMNGNIQELWKTDSLGNKYLKTIYIARKGGFTEQERKMADEQWQRIRKKYGNRLPNLKD